MGADQPELRVIDGFPDFAVGSDRTVWSCRGRRADPETGAPAHWKRLRLSARSDRGNATVIIYREGEFLPFARTIESLYRAAFSKPREFEHPGGPDRTPQDPEYECLDDEGLDAPEPEPAAPGRPIAGHPGYVIDSARRIWSNRRRKGIDPPGPVAWHPIRTRHNRGRATVALPDGKGSVRTRSVEVLYRRAFAEREPDHPGGRAKVLARARGNRHGRAKLTTAKVIEAKRLRAAGSTYKDLAERYDVSLTAITFAIKGRTWRHVPDA
jgi:hypothetical protein